MRILVVEDSESIRYAVELFFKLEGLECETACNVDAGNALVLAHAEHNLCFDVVLLDLNMPGLPAETLIATLRGISAGTKILLFSGSCEAKDAVHRLGVDGWLEKPISFDRLLSQVQEVAGAHDLRSKAAHFAQPPMATANVVSLA